MSFRDKLAKKTAIPKEKLPASYQLVGDVLLIKFMKIKSLEQKKEIGKAIKEILPYVKTVCEITGISSEFRVPKIKKLIGNGTETIHKEHGIKYKLDAAKIMFSKGNLFERQRLLKQVRKNEVVVDMFAGIGYFSLSIAKKCKKVYAIEKNPVAYKYLKENIKLNRIKNIVPIKGDNRKVKMNEKADRILMGYFPGTEKFLPAAKRMIKKKGIIHYHNIYKEKDLWKKPLSELGNTKILSKKKVKSVAPKTYHVVVDTLVF